MADGVVFISDSDSESSRSLPLRRRCCRRPLPPPADIIDLTCEDVSTAPLGSLIIDLTEDTCSPTHTTSCAEQDPAQVPAAPAAHTSHPQPCSTITPKTEATAEPTPAAPWHSAPTDPSATMDMAESAENWSSFSPASSRCSSEQNCSTTTFNSDLGSLASMQLDSDLLSLSPSSLDSSSSWRASGLGEQTPHPCEQREMPLRSSSASATPTTPRTAPEPSLEVDDLPPLGIIQHVTPARTKAVSKAWLNKLHYFKRSGVQHFFFQGNREKQQMKPELIPSGRLSMVHTTMEENFIEGTLHFLNEFISCRYCPPKEIVSYLITEILLNPHQEEILKDTYMLLMKIQTLHPANVTTVGWDWTLLKYIMEDEVLGIACHIGQSSSSTSCLREKLPGRLLFLQYVVQTLEDDFQQNLRLRLLQKSIAKKVLSCDKCFSNVKEVVEWLVAAVTGVGFTQPREQPQEMSSSSVETRAEGSSSAPRLASTNQAEVAPPAFFTQKVMLLLQRMLSIAVEVDRSPNCSSCKIADVMLPFILNIPLRSQREAFLNTMESQLLRCKLLDLLFQHSCHTPTTLPLSLSKILHFLSHFSLLLQCQEETATWQRWDEMLQYLILLLLSYQNVMLEHLRSSLSDRMDLIIQKAKPKRQDSDDISQLDIQLKIQDFINQMQHTLGQPFPLQITEKLCTLQELFLIVTATRC